MPDTLAGRSTRLKERLLISRRLASSAQVTGVLGALESLAPVPGLVVLNYHRIGTTVGNPVDDATFSTTPEGFREQVVYLQQRYALPPVSDVVDGIVRGRFDQPTALITFDDGYQDNYEFAFPVLRSLNVPACFFVMSGYLDQPSLPWWDRVAYSVKWTSQTVLQLEYPERLRIDLASTSRARATYNILRAYKRTRALDRERFFHDLETATGVTVDESSLARGLFMSWDQARKMHDGGMTIGSHTATHPVLSSVDEETQRRELVNSRQRIADMIGHAPDLLAYPVGGPGAFTEATKRIAQAAGYRAAFTYFGGLNRTGHIDPFAVGRSGVSHAESFTQFRLKTTMQSLRWPLR